MAESTPRASYFSKQQTGMITSSHPRAQTMADIRQPTTWPTCATTALRVLRAPDQHLPRRLLAAPCPRTTPTTKAGTRPRRAQAMS